MYLIFVLAWLLVSFSFKAQGETIWDAFIEKPTYANYKIVESNIKRCNSSMPLCPEVPKASSVIKLIAIIEKGNINAIDLGFQLHKSLSGGDLENMSRALGALADVDPRLFLEEVKRENFSSRELAGIVQMLSADSVDDVDKTRQYIEARIQSLLSVNLPDLSGTKNEAVSVLKGHLAEIPKDSSR